MATIIGLDFGNYNSFPSYIRGMNPATRKGGEPTDLLPDGLNDGIPSVYFYTKQDGKPRVLCGESAVRGTAVPVANRLRYLKRHIDETVVLDGETIRYEDAITAVIQHCVRSANAKLKSGWGETTNLISLAYPVTFLYHQIQRLIELAERATLEDGRKVRVYGTIAEPAAAALDYLSENFDNRQQSTVLTYDLGGGTFDLALVAAFVNGRKNVAGETYFYDVLDCGGIEKLGGVDFDGVMFELLKQKFNVPLKPTHERRLMEKAEIAKKELSDPNMPMTIVTLDYGDDILEATVSRAEFEKASAPLLRKTIDVTAKFLEKHPNQQPELILLTGGASKMPMVKAALEARLPQYSGKIQAYRPSTAISYGAARFGTNSVSTPVQTRVLRDIGVRYYHSKGDRVGFIDTVLRAGTPIPFDGESVVGRMLQKGRYSRDVVFEAKGDNPDPNNPERDYTPILSVRIDYGKEVPEGTRSTCRLSVSKSGVITAEARDISSDNRPIIKNSIQLEHIG